MDPRETQCGRRFWAAPRPALGTPRSLPYFFLFLAFLCLTSCETLRHRFTQPEPDWQSRIGQLQYRGPKTSLIGEVLVRYSTGGDFELTFSKGPGVTLLVVQQDDNFVRVSGPLARGSWSGPPNQAPVHLRGWTSLRELLLHSKSETLVRQTVGPESFVFALLTHAVTDVVLAFHCPTRHPAPRSCLARGRARGVAQPLHSYHPADARHRSAQLAPGEV